MTMHVCVDVCVCDTAHNSNVHNSNVSLKETTNMHPQFLEMWGNVIHTMIHSNLTRNTP